MKPTRNVITRWILAVLYIVLGIALIVCGVLKVVDEYWTGMGTAFAFVGALQIIRLIRYTTNAAVKESTDTAVNDERNRFLRSKSWAWAGYLYIMIAAVASIVFKLLHQETLMLAASGSVCLLLVLYWVSFFILRKKY